MIFKTITDETTLSGQKIVGALQARKIAQQQATAQLEIDIACLKEYQVACQNGTVTTEQFDAIMHKASASAVEYSAKVKAGTGTAQSYANAQRATNSALQEVSIGAGIASKAVKLFSTALNMIAFTAIIQGISWLIGKVDEWIVTAKEAKESADAFKESLSAFFNETQTNLKTISSLSDRFNELSKNVDDNGKKIGGTEEEYAEFLDICQQVGQIMPELITGYTAEGEAIITLQGKVDSLTDSYREAIRTKAALFLSNGDEDGNSIKSFFEDYNDFVNGYQGVLGLKTSPSGQNTAEEFEKYYGYNKIHGWLSDVTDATLEDLEKLRAGTTGYVYLGRVLKEAGYEISEISAENYNAVHDVFNSRMSVMEKGITDRVTNIRTAFQNMLYADSDYWKIDDENVISAINSLYASIDDEFIKQNELFNQTALQTFESDFVSLFNNDATKKAMVDFYTPIADDETVQNYTNRINSALQEIQLYCNNNGIVIPIEVNNSIDTLVNNVKEKLQDDFDSKVGELTLEELQIAAEQVEVPDGTLLSWDELIAKIKEVQDSTSNIENPISTFEDVWADSFTSENESVKKLGDSLIGLAEKGRLTVDAFNEADSTGYFKNLGISADEAVDEVNKLVDESKQLSSMSDQISKMANALGTKQENGFVDADILADFDVEVHGLESWDRFQKVLGSATSSYEECQKAANDLAAEWVNSSDFLVKLTDDTKEYYKTQLQYMGVTNADEIIESTLALKEAKEAVSEIDLSEATQAEIQSLILESEYTGLAATQIWNLYAAKLAEQASAIDSSSDCQQLLNLRNDANFTAETIRLLTELMLIYSGLESGVYSKSGRDREYAFERISQIKTEIDKLVKDGGLTVEPAVELGNKGKSPAKSAGKSAKETEKEVDIMAELNSEMDEYQSKLDAVKDARETYNKYGKITVDQAQDIVDADFKLLAAYGDEEAALESLGQAKLNEMQIQLARNAIDTINNITSEAEATEYLAGANEHLAGTSLSATEAMLQQAVAAAKVRGAMQGQAADTILKGYQNGAMMLGQVDFGFKIPDEKKEKDSKKEAEKEKDFSKQMDWIERLLNRLSKATEKLKDSAEKFVSWWRKNNALDKAMRANRKEISGNEDAYYYYLKKANSVGLSKKYKKLVQDGSIRIQDVKDEGLADKIEKYQEWYDKAQDCRDAIEDLYDAEREMINQKYDNMLEFYDSLDEKIQSVINKVESLMGLKEARGKQIDINDLLEEFDAYEDVIGQMQESEKTSGQNKDDHTEIIEVSVSDRDLNGEITEAVKQSAIYKGLLSDIEKLEAKREKKGKLSKADTAKLESFYAKRKELEEKATADTIVQYNKTYDAFMKLQAKLDKGQSLSKSQRIKYDQYKAELEGFEKQRQNQIADLQKELDNVPEKITDPGQSYEKRKEEIRSSYESQISDAQNDVRNTKQYKALKAEIENLEAAQAKKGLSKSKQEKLDAKRAELAALERGATSVNISEYIKAYERFTKLSNKKTLSKKERSEYDTLSAQLKQWDQSKQDSINQLREQMNDTLENLASEQGNAANDAASSLADNQAKAYETAKKIAEIGASALQSELDVLDSYMSKMEKRLSLYQKFGVESLKKLGYIESDLDTTQSELIMDEFKNYLKNSNEKRDKLIGQRDIYQKLIDSVNTHDYDEIKKMYEGGVFEQYGDTFDKVIALLKDNTFDGYSLEWVKEWEQSVSDIDQSIDDINIKIQDLQDTMREEVTFRAINEAVTQLGYLKDELSSMSGLFSEEILYGEDGSLSEYGVGKAAVLIEQLENSQKLAMEYREKYTRALSDDTFASEKDKQEYLNNLKNQYMQELNETKSFTEQIVSLYEKQKASEVNALKDIIKKRKEALQAKKEYYDWDKNLKEKNKDIDALKAQIAAVETVNTAESKAKLESLKAELAQKEEELNELKEDHLYDMQMDALDQFSEWLSEDTEAKLKSLEYQKEIVDKLSEITEGHDINDTISALEQFYLGLSGKDSIFNGHEIAANAGTGIKAEKAMTPVTDQHIIDIEEGIRNGEIVKADNEFLIESLRNLPQPQWNVPMLNAVNQSGLSEIDYERVVPNQTNIDIHYDSMMRVDGNVDSFVVSDLQKYMEDQYKYTKRRLTSDLKKVGVHK